MIQWLLRWLFPPKCALCERLLEPEETDLCRECRTHGPDCPVQRKKLPFLDSWTAVWYYEGNVRGSILRFKFQGATNYAQTYGRLLAMKLLEAHPEGFDVLTYVPVSSLRRFRRGYDQVELVADAVAEELDMDVLPVLKKIRHNQPQSGIHGDAHRRANVSGAYQVTDVDAIKGKRILLLDDVITTGATLGECARILLTAGASEVHGAAVAAVRHSGKQSR